MSVSCGHRFLALTPWRVYHLISVMLLGRVIMQIIKDMVLSRTRGKNTQIWLWCILVLESKRLVFVPTY